MIVSRRSAIRGGLVASVGVAAFLIGCSSPSSTAQFEQAKSYWTAANSTLQAAGAAYLAGPPAPSAAQAAIVQTALATMQKVTDNVQGLTAPANWKAGILEGLAAAQQIYPIVAPLLGPAAPYVPLAIAVIQAFVNSLPPPADAPAQPPAQLSRKSVVRRG